MKSSAISVSIPGGELVRSVSNRPILHLLRKIICYALIVVSSYLPLHAQRDSIPIFHSAARDVLLDVVVTDQSGRPVYGLNQSDFVVTENESLQKLSSFEPPTAAEEGVSSSVGRSNVQNRDAVDSPRPQIILLIDELNMSFEDVAYARTSLTSFFFHDAIEAPTALMVLRVRDLSFLQNFTTDRHSLLKAVNALAAASGARAGGFVGPALAAEYANRALAALEQIARAAVGYPSRLNVIWITKGFPQVLQFSSERGDSDLLQGMREVANLLLQSRMSLYTIDPSGVIQESPVTNAPASSTPPGMDLRSGDVNTREFNADALLSRITRDTGGRSYFNRNDIDRAIGQAVQDGLSSYQLAYMPTNQNFDGSYRKIEVRVNTPGVIARTRQGYYAVASEEAVSTKERNTRLKAALGSPLPYHGIGISTAKEKYEPATRALSARLLVRPQGIFHASNASQIAWVVALSSTGKVLGSWSWGFSWQYSGSQKPVILPINQILPPKTDRVRVLVADQNADRIGTLDLTIN